MSWKDYQIKETYRSETRRLTRRVILTTVAIGVLAYGAFAIHRQPTQVAKVLEKLPSIIKIKPTLEEFNQIVNGLSFSSLQEGPKEVKVFRGGKDWKLELTYDSDLQKFIYNKLRQYQVDWAGVSVLDPKTGAVKALVSYSAEDADTSQWSIKASFPAASIFKMVTAGAAVQEKHFSQDTVLNYGGDTRYLQKRFLTTDRGQGISLGDAFAHSTNAIFGKVGVRFLGKTLLSQYATAFGFNETLPFEFPVEQSVYANSTDDDLVNEAKTAAGLGSVTLSPLHASLIAASVVNDGNMMKPYSIEKITTDNDQPYFQAIPTIWKTPLTEQTCLTMQKMMRMTILNGTARKGFRDYHTDSVLNSLDIGGKTGSLTGKEPEGKNEWFIGFAKDGKETLAVGIVIVDKKTWKIRPSELAKSLIRFHFKSVRDGEPKDVSDNQPARAVKKATL